MAKTKKTPSLKVPREDVREKPRTGLLVATGFGVLVLILITFAYTMTSQYVFNDGINYGTLQTVKEASDFWLKLFATAITSPYSQQWLKATYAWDIGSFGNSPGWAHAANISLHIVSCLYFFVFVFRLAWIAKIERLTKINPYYVAAASAGLLACHPLTTGSIAYISGRSGVLAGANYFLALNCFLFGFLEAKLARAFCAYALFFLFTIIGVASSVQCFTLPFAALSLTFILKPGELRWREWIADRWVEMSMVLLPGLILCFFFIFPYPAQVDSGFALQTLPAPIYWASQLKLIITYYLRCALVPIRLSVNPPFALASGWMDPATVAGAAVLIALTVLAFVRKNPLIRFSIVLFLFGLMPWIFVVQPELVADTRFYISLSGLALAAGIGIASLASANLRRTAIAFGALLLALSALSIWRETEWSNDKRLWKAEVRNNPEDARAHAYRARQFLVEQKLPEGKKELDKALQLNPDDFVARSESAFLDFQKKDFKHGVVDLEKTIELGEKLKIPPDKLAIYHRDLAEAYTEMGDQAKASDQALSAFEFIKGDPFLYLTIAKSLLRNHQPILALQQLRDGLKLDKSNRAYLEPIAQAYLDVGQNLPQAYTLAKRAWNAYHTHSCSVLYIRACLELGKIDEAQPLIDLMTRGEPNNAEVFLLASAFDKLQGDMQKSEADRKKALALDPQIETKIKLYLRNKRESAPSPSAKVDRPAVPAQVTPAVPTR